MSNFTTHTAIWDERLAYGEKKTRIVRCTCGWASVRGYDSTIKPAFAQHKRDAKAAEQEASK